MKKVVKSGIKFLSVMGFCLLGITTTASAGGPEATAECINGRWEIEVTGDCVDSFVDCQGEIPAIQANGTNTYIRNYSRCPAGSEACFWDVADAPGGTGKPELKKNDASNTKDTMFSIHAGAGADGFIERNKSYKGAAITWNNIQASKEKLVWVQRQNASGDQPLRMMIPTKKSDYDKFIAQAEADGMIKTSRACMPIEIKLCAGVKAATPRPCTGGGGGSGGANDSDGDGSTDSHG